MNLRIPLSLFAIFFASSNCFCQQNGGYLMKWKIKHGEPLVYKTVLEEVDTANRRDIDVSAMAKLFSGLDNDSLQRRSFKELNKVLTQSAHYLTTLEKGKGNLIDIVISDPDSTQMKAFMKFAPDDKEAKAMLSKMTAGAMLRGAITDEGQIASFYTKNDQKNMIAQFFELPGKPVKEGDSWPLTINYISMDQNFKCDSSYHENQVTVTHIGSQGGEHIVQLKYKVVEFVIGDFNSPFGDKAIKTSMKFTLDAIADFSIEKGRWVDYNGVISMNSTGIMEAQTTKRIALIPN